MAEEADSLRHVVALTGSAGAVPIILRQVARLRFRDASSLFVMYHRAGDERFQLGDLADGSLFEVESAVDGSPVRANRVYYPDRSNDLEVRDGRLAVRPPAARYHPNIDRLLESLAAEFGPRVTAVVLSGLGSDGVRGAEAVDGAGGRVIVQDPDDAPFPQLPTAVLRAGVDAHVVSSAMEVHATVERILRGPERADLSWLRQARER